MSEWLVVFRIPEQWIIRTSDGNDVVNIRGCKVTIDCVDIHAMVVKDPNTDGMFSKERQAVTAPSAGVTAGIGGRTLFVGYPTAVSS